MADGYEALYRRMLGESQAADAEPDPERVVEIAARR